MVGALALLVVLAGLMTLEIRTAGEPDYNPCGNTYGAFGNESLKEFDPSMAQQEHCH
jgi:hypothetical protein